MKTRFIVYGSLLFVSLMLPVVYKSINQKLDKQEYNLREQKKQWLSNMVNIEFNLSRKAISKKDKRAYWFHVNRELEYLTMELEMIQEDLDKLG